MCGTAQPYYHPHKNAEESNKSKKLLILPPPSTQPYSSLIMNIFNSKSKNDSQSQENCAEIFSDT